MKLRNSKRNRFGRAKNRASVLVVVLWISIGLVSIALYFANSMMYELRASDNRASGLAAEQAIEGAARYVTYVLQTYATNGLVPDKSAYACEDVPVGDSHFWIIGRDPDQNNSADPYFSLIDEASKLNLNSVDTNTLAYLPNMTFDFAVSIDNWRGTNGDGLDDYTAYGYVAKYAPFETVDELRLVYNMNLELLVGEDANFNGVLDANEKDLNGNGRLDPGLLEYLTVYTREPNFHADGTMLTNVNTATDEQLDNAFQAAGISTAYARQIQNNRPYSSLLAFAARCRQSGMTTPDFGTLCDYVTISTNTYITNRINVNTASENVLVALLMGLNNGDETTAETSAETLINYREENTNDLSSLAWVYDALGAGNATLTTLEQGDYLTTKSYQFTADIAAVGPLGRGYRRVKFIFDTSGGAPKIIYRQDLTGLGWALGDKVRQMLLTQNTQ